MRAFDAPLSSLFSTCINLPPPAAMSCNGATTHLHLCPSRVSTAYFAAMRHIWPLSISPSVACTSLHVEHWSVKNGAPRTAYKGCKTFSIKSFDCNTSLSFGFYFAAVLVFSQHRIRGAFLVGGLSMGTLAAPITAESMPPYCRKSFHLVA